MKSIDYFTIRPEYTKERIEEIEKSLVKFGVSVKEKMESINLLGKFFLR